MENIDLIRTCNTMRSGFQEWGDTLAYSLDKKLKMVGQLERYGGQYIEGNWPFSIPVLSNDLIESGFLMAILLFLTIFIMPLFSRELRQNKQILIGYVFVIGLHQIMAFTNACIYQTLMARNDARGFHIFARELARNEGWNFDFSIGQEFYIDILTTVYRWFGSSHLLGEQLSILAFALSCIVFLKILRQLEAGRYRLFALLAFGAYPTMIVYGSITVRESYEVFFFMLTVYFGIKMAGKGGANLYLIALILSALAAGFFHQALIFYMVFLVLLFLAWTFLPITRLKNIKKLSLVAWIIIPFFLVGIIIFLNMKMLDLRPANRGVFSTLIDVNWLEAISNYRVESIKNSGRTAYGVYLDITSSYMMVYSGLKLYVYYLFAPFPWNIGSLTDLYASTESIMRMILICFSVKQWRKAYGSQRRLLGLMLILYFSITFMWALGTTNYGTAMRHHMLSWWIIVIIGIPPLMKKLGRFLFRSIVNSSSHRLEVTSENLDRN